MSVQALILNWNGLDATRRCLASLSIPYLVIDNGSSDGSAEALAAALPPEQFLALPENLGFAGGLNQALPRVGAPYVLLLNNDAELAPDTVDRLVAALEATPAAAAATPTIFQGAPPERDTYWYAGGRLGRWSAIVHHAKAAPDGRTHPVSYASACCLLLRTATLRELGGLPEGYFMYFEDVELCDRLTAANHQILWVSAAEAWHAGGASTGSQATKAPALDYYDLRNGLEFIRRRRHGAARLSAWLYLALVRLPRKFARILLSAPAPGPALSAAWRGLADGLAGRLGRF